jgi:hypothetical protein
MSDEELLELLRAAGGDILPDAESEPARSILERIRAKAPQDHDRSSPTTSQTEPSPAALRAPSTTIV